MKVCLWSGKSGFESLSRNPRPNAGFEDSAPTAARAETENGPRNFSAGSENPCTRGVSGHPLDRAITASLLVCILALIIGLLVAPRSAHARPAWPIVTSTWYGPGFYGNRTACGQRYSQRIRGVAHRTLPCGSRITLRRRGVTLRVRVIDRGPYSGATFDLSARTAMDLCRCQRPYTMRHRWTRGWHTTPTNRSNA